MFRCVKYGVINKYIYFLEKYMSNIHVPSGVKRVVMAHVSGVMMVACCMTLHDTA